MGNIDSGTRGICNLRERQTQLTAVIQHCVGMYLGADVGPNADDMAHFMKDSAVLCQQQQQSEA